MLFEARKLPLFRLSLGLRDFGCPGIPHRGDWVFASPTMKGEQPYWPDNLMKRYIKPVARQYPPIDFA
jgi:hypothetical protein